MKWHPYCHRPMNWDEEPNGPAPCDGSNIWGWAPTSIRASMHQPVEEIGNDESILPFIRGCWRFGRIRLLYATELQPCYDERVIPKEWWRRKNLRGRSKELLTARAKERRKRRVVWGPK